MSYNTKLSSVMIWSSQLSGEVQPPRPFGSRVAPLIQGRLTWLAAEKKKKQDWTSSFSLDGTRPTTRTVELHSRRRAASVYLALREALETGCGFVVPAGQDDESLPNLVEFFVCLDLVDLLLPWIKEQTAYAAAVGLGQEETNLSACQAMTTKVAKALGVGEEVVPKPGVVVPTGWIKRCLKSIMAPSSRLGIGAAGQRRLFNAQNVLFIKRGCPPAEPWIVAKTVADHAIALGDPKAHPDLPPRGPEADAPALRELVKEAIDDLVHSLFSGQVFEPSFRFPSLNACVERGRAEGGALANIASLAQSSFSDGNVLGDYLDRMVEVAPGKVVEIRGLARVQAAIDHSVHVVLDSAQKWANLPAVKALPILPQAICEPCKIRMITMGPAEAYNLACCLQKFLWKTLSRCRFFQWTSKPITSEDWRHEYYGKDVLRWLLEKESRTMVSGDYKGATDNLNPELSEYVAEAISSELRVSEVNVANPWGQFSRSEWASLLTRCLTGHLLGHGKERRKWVRKAANEYGALLDNSHLPAPLIEQRWGQLMGSPVSFPVLNLVNAAATAVGTGWVPGCGRSVLKHMALRRIHTNGDDVAFLSEDQNEYRFWGRVVSSCGLAPSLGKNYRSRVFLIINSEMRVLVPLHHEAPAGDEWVDPNLDVFDVKDEGGWVKERLTAVWQDVPFLNQSLLFGLEAKGPDSGKSILPKTPYFQAGSYAQALCMGVKDDCVRTRWMYRFSEYWREVLDRAPAGCLWEAPQALGGLGLPAFRTTLQVPDQVMKSIAYVSCLDTATRCKLVTPPALSQVSNPWEQSIAEVTRHGVKVGRISSRTFFDVGAEVADAWLREAHPEGGSLATWGELLVNFDSLQQPEGPGSYAWLVDALREAFHGAWNPESGFSGARWNSVLDRVLQLEDFSLEGIEDLAAFYRTYPGGIEDSGLNWLTLLWFFPVLYRFCRKVPSRRSEEFYEQSFGTVLTEYRAKRGDKELTLGDFRTEYPEISKKILAEVRRVKFNDMPEWMQKMTDPNLLIKAARKAERQFSKRLTQMYGRAESTSLRPMSLATMSTWEDHRVWEELTLRPNYRGWVPAHSRVPLAFGTPLGLW